MNSTERRKVRLAFFSLHLYVDCFFASSEDKLKKTKRKLENGNELPKKKAKKQKVQEEVEESVDEEESQNESIEQTKAETTGKFRLE